MDSRITAKIKIIEEKWVWIKNTSNRLILSYYITENNDMKYEIENRKF